MRITGHKTREAFERYNIINEQDLRNIANKMDSANSELGQNLVNLESAQCA